MRKSVTYNIEIRVDQGGNIREAECECAAGMGPNAHCKHIVSVIYCMVKFFMSGNLNTEQTCTEKLQSFHKAKKYNGSPVKMGKLCFGTEKTKEIRYDPRKSQYVKNEGYNDYVRNLAVNFSLKTPSFPFMQTIKPANPYAISNDHDYCANSEPDADMPT